MPYSKINPDDMILRDHLAYDRTVLANERTMLSYLRTSIALLAAGGTLIKIFSGDRLSVIVGSILLVFGGASIVIGIWRFISVKKNLSRVYEDV